MDFIKKVFKSFPHAFAGLKLALVERNMIVHLLAAVLVTGAGIWLKVNYLEWIALVIVIGLVIAMEIMNTAVEDVCNVLRDTQKLDYSATKKARDLAAAAVLVMTFVAIVVGLIIFLPKVIVFI